MTFVGDNSSGTSMEESPAMYRSISILPLSITSLKRKLLNGESSSEGLIKSFDQRQPLYLCEHLCSSSLMNDDEEFVVKQRPVWRIRENSVRPTPPFDPVEKTSKVIVDSTADDVASRISDCLRRRCIDCTYSDTKAMAKCIKMDGVKLHDCTAILNASDGIPPSFSSEEGEETFPALRLLPLPLPCFIPSTKRNEDGSETDPLPVGDMISLPSSLLKESRTDQQQLGMMNLCDKTDHVKFGLVTSFKTALAILENEHNILETLTDFVEQYHSCLQNGDSPTKEETMRYGVVLKTLSNVVHTLFLKKDDAESVMMEHALFFDKLLSWLMVELKSVNEEPRPSYFASRCLVDLMVFPASSMKATANQMNAKRFLINAHIERAGFTIGPGDIKPCYGRQA